MSMMSALMFSYNCRFGKYGRETGCLIMVFRQRGLEVRILDRKFTIQKLQSTSKNVDEKDTPLPLP